nr:unnamed protein product [Callosobruchus analis]
MKKLPNFFNFHFLQRAFSVVEFEDGVCLVPSKWLFRNSTMCFYPPYVNQLKIIMKEVLQNLS